MQITIDTNNLSETDVNFLRVLVGDAPAPTEAAPAAKKPTTAKKAAAKPEPTPEPEADDAVADDSSDADADAPTLEDAVALATKLVSAGKSKEVKAALTDVGAKRVSEVDEDKIGELIAALEAI
jgi:hypothetical protein